MVQPIQPLLKYATMPDELDDGSDILSALKYGASNGMELRNSFSVYSS